MANSGGDFSALNSKSTPVREDQSEREVSGYVFDIKRYAIHDGPGIRTTVFFKGCPLQCRWCHNPESWSRYPELGFRGGRCVRCGRCVDACGTHAISLTADGPMTDVDKCELCGECVGACLNSAREIIGQEMTVRQVMREVEKDVVFYDESGGGITFSGGEPLAQSQFLLAVLAQCQTRQIHTAVDTTCHADPETIRAVAERTDLFLCDIKHMDSTAHEHLTGVDNCLILGNIKRLSEAGARIVVRIPIVPGFNDDQGNIHKTAEFVGTLTGIDGIDILPYNGGGKEKAARLGSAFRPMETEVPSQEGMRAVADIFRQHGFEVKIGG